MKRLQARLVFAAMAVVMPASFVRAAAPPTTTGPVQVTVTVTETDHQPLPELTRQDVMVFQNNQRRPVLGLEPISASAKGLDLAILIDGSLGSAVSLQFPDIRSFIASLQPSAAVGVAYSEYGRARFTQDFTTDHAKAEAALSIPEGRINAGGSIFQSVTDLVKHWPADGRAHSVLLVSNGVDINRGVSETLPMLNPDLNEAIHQAQKAGVIVYTIYAGGAAGFTHQWFLLDNGQSMLARIAEETGGEAYFEGNETPVSFSPFLKQLSNALNRQYVLTFEAMSMAKPGQARLRVTTELPHVHIAAPALVQVPAN
jgi:VWFA-related protein